MAATRLYFAATGTPAITPTFDSLWASTASAAQRPLWTAAQLAGTTNSNSTQLNETSTTNAFDRLCRQHATDSQVASAHTISGTFSMVIGGVESSVNLNGFLQVVITVWDSTGTTKRGTLYSGTTNTSESSTVGAINEEFGTSLATRIINAQAVTSVAAQVGDRIVVEFGYRACNTSSTSMGVAFRMDDRSGATGDHTLASGTTTTGLRPWIEFSDDIFASGSVTGTLATTLDGSTLAASGTETISGTLASTLAGATLAGSGAETFTGTLATTLAGGTLAASGTETISGTAATTLAGATLSASGTETISGTLATTLDGATLAGSGTAGSSGATGTLATTLAGATLAATGVETITGTASVALAGAALSAIATEQMTGALAATLAGATLAAAGTSLVNVTGTLAVTLEGATLAADGDGGLVVPSEYAAVRALAHRIPVPERAHAVTAAAHPSAVAVPELDRAVATSARPHRIEA